MELGLVEAIVSGTVCDDNEVINFSLKAVDELLNRGEAMKEYMNENIIYKRLEENEIVRVLDELQHHKDETIYKEVLMILEKHFEVSDLSESHTTN